MPVFGKSYSGHGWTDRYMVACLPVPRREGCEYPFRRSQRNTDGHQYIIRGGIKRRLQSKLYIFNAFFMLGMLNLENIHRTKDANPIPRGLHNCGHSKLRIVG
jgi:hypothetical protein